MTRPRAEPAAAALGRVVVDAFARALTVEAHNIAERPDLVWQQLDNRLRGDSDAVVAVLDAERLARTGGDGPIWCRLLTRTVGSPAERLALLGHGHVVQAADVAPDGTFLVSASTDGTVCVWDAASGARTARLTGHRGEVSGCAVGPDGTVAVSVGEDSTLRLWDPRAGIALGSIENLPSPGTACVIGPDGSSVHIAHDDRRIRTWDLATGVERWVSKEHRSALRTLSVSPDGRTLACCGADGTVWLWDLVRHEASALESGGRAEVWDCAIGADGTTLLSADAEGMLRVWDAVSGELRLAFRAHEGQAFACAVAPDAAFLVSGGADRIVRTWDARTGTPIASYTGHAFWVRGCAVTPDGGSIVSASADKSIRVWDVRDLVTEPVVTPTGHSDAVHGCAWTPDGSQVVTAGFDGSVGSFDGATGAGRRLLRGHEGRVNACAVDPLGRFAVSGGADGVLRMWMLDDGEERPLLRQRATIRACDVGPDGGSVVWGGDDRVAALWDVAGGRVRAQLVGHAESVRACRVSPDGSFVVTGDKAGALAVWDAETGRELGTRKAHAGEILACAVSPDSSLLISASADHTLAVWNRLLDPVARLRGHRDWVFACDVSPDGAYLLSASTDMLLKVWEVGSWREVAALPMSRPLYCAAFHPSVPRIVCGDLAGSVHLIDLENVTWGAPPMPRSIIPPMRHGGVPPSGAVHGGSEAVALDANTALQRAMEASGLRFVRDGARVQVRLQGLAGTTVVQGVALEDGLVAFSAPLPSPRRRDAEMVYRLLLHLSGGASIAKVLGDGHGGLAIGAAVPVPLLTPSVAEALIRAVGSLADVTPAGLADERGWQVRLGASQGALSRLVSLDLPSAREAIVAEAQRLGIACEIGDLHVLLGLGTLRHAGLDTIVTVAQEAASFVALLGAAPAGGKARDALHALLDLNRTVSVAKIGLAPDGGMALLYESPGVMPGLLGRVREECGALLDGLLQAVALAPIAGGP